MNCAATADRPETRTLHTRAPVQPPPQRTNREPPFAVGVRSTREPAANAAAHFPGHEIPAGVLVMRPPPTMATANVGVAVAALVLDPPEPPNAPVAVAAASAATPTLSPILVHTVFGTTIRLFVKR